MTHTALQQTPDTDLDPCIDSAVNDYVENASRTDGSRTPAWKTARVIELKRAGRTVNAIGQILGMDSRTIQAVLSRGDSLVTDARMLLNAHALGFAGDAIKASEEAAKRGKIEGITQLLDRLGVTEPPKSSAHTQIGVSVVLNGGPAPGELSLAKVTETSEGLSNQAVIEHGPIISVTLPVSTSPQVIHTQALSADTSTAQVNHEASDTTQPTQPATFVAESEKQA